MSEPDEIVTDAERFPLLTPHGRALLERLREHPAAPRFTARSGNRLTEESLRRVRAFAGECSGPPPAWQPGVPPPWLRAHLEECVRDVPFYRRHGDPPDRWEDLPTFGRVELSREPWSFVPDRVPAEGLVMYTTTGTTGQPLLVPSHPAVAGCYLPLLQRALAWHGVEMTSRRGQVACVLVGYQKDCFTYASVAPLLDEAGFVKLNLYPDDWRDPVDRVRYLDAFAPEIYTGDPISFTVLAELPLAHRPKALISTSMTLLPGVRGRLERRFACPVLDLYALNESGPVAVSLPHGPFALLQPRLYVEVLDPQGRPCEPGERGEIVLSGGFNFCLPLLRYRTGDFAALTWEGTLPHLSGLEGRPPTVFRGRGGALINNIEITHALQPFPLSQFSLHQSADGAFRLRVRNPSPPTDTLRAALLSVLGRTQELTVECLDDLGEKVIQYTTDLQDDGA